jgi:hypothetical protein
VSSHAERYKPYPHRARNARYTHKAEQQAQGFNQRIALAITRALGSVPCMYFFVVLALIGFPGLYATPQQYVQWLSQTLIQLVALSVLAIAQNVLNRQTEIQSDAMFETDTKTFHDAEILIQQGNEQLKLIEAHTEMLENHYQELRKQTEMLATLLTPPVTIRRKVRKQEVAE